MNDTMTSHDRRSRLDEWADLVGDEVPESALEDGATEGSSADRPWGREGDRGP